MTNSFQLGLCREWFAVEPHLTSSGVRGQVKNQGYVGLANTNLTYPALGVNENGAGVMAFTQVGTNDFPSAAYASFTLEKGVGSIHVVAAGVGPDDGFTGYAAYNAPNPVRTRWGDYGAAVVDGSNIWIASEYIGQSCTYAQWFADTNVRDRYNYLYSNEELKPWAARIQKVSKQAGTVFVITNNHYQGKGVVNALQLINILTKTKVNVPEPLRQHFPQLDAIAASRPVEPTLFPLATAITPDAQ